MRLLLFIPAFILFLSNMPFVTEISLEAGMTMMQNDESCAVQKECRKNENRKGSCVKQETACDKQTGCGDGETNKNTDLDLVGDNACQKTETTCVCICCFQFAAPEQQLPEFQFDCADNSNTPFAFIVGYIKNPHIGAPWQPPDVV